MRRFEPLLNIRSGRHRMMAGVAVGLMAMSVPLCADASTSRKREEAAKAALTPETQVSLGRRFEAKGDTEMALGLYQKVLNEKPDNEEALRALVSLAVRTNRAAVVLDEAVRLAAKRPLDAEAQLWLATSLNEQGRASDALAALAEAEKIGSLPLPAQLWTQRGIAQDVAGNHLEAQRAFSHAVTLNPGDPQLPLRLALSLALQEDYPAALRILQMQVNDPLMERPVRETLAIIYALSGQTGQAIDIARTATGQDLADSQRGYLMMLPRLAPQARAYAAHFRRINDSLPAAAPVQPATPKAESVPQPVPAPQLVPAPQPAPVPDPSKATVEAEPVQAAAAPAVAPLAEAVEPTKPVAEPPVASAPVAAPVESATVSGAGYWLQLASLNGRDKAHKAWAEATAKAASLLKERPAFVQVHAQNGTTYHRLMTGPFESLEQARAMLGRLGAHGIKPVIKRDVGAIEPLKP